MYGAVMGLVGLGLTARAAAPDQLRPDLPRAMSDVCLRCLAKPPNERYETVRELREALMRRRLSVTFNGSCFDVPVLRQHFPQLRPPAAHLDLRFIFRRLGHGAGLKALEARGRREDRLLLERNSTLSYLGGAGQQHNTGRLRRVRDGGKLERGIGEVGPVDHRGSPQLLGSDLPSQGPAHPGESQIVRYDAGAGQRPTTAGHGKIHHHPANGTALAVSHQDSD
jgi:hypothetical protein